MHSIAEESSDVAIEDKGRQHIRYGDRDNDHHPPINPVIESDILTQRRIRQGRDAIPHPESEDPLLIRPPCQSAVVYSENPVPLIEASENSETINRPESIQSGSSPGKAIRSPKESQSLKRRLFPRLVALRVAFPEWDDHLQSGRWHTDFILSRANPEDLEDYRAVLSVVPFNHIGSSASPAESPFSTPQDRRLAICVLQGLDALRLDLDPEFRPLSHNELLDHVHTPTTASAPSCRANHTSGYVKGNRSTHHPLSQQPPQSLYDISSSFASRRHVRTTSPGLFPYQHDSMDGGGEQHDFSRMSPQMEERLTTEDFQLRSPIKRLTSPSPRGSDHDEDVSSNHDVLPVDSFFPHRKKFHVFRWGRTEWSCHLVREDRNSSHQFFVMQLLEKNLGDEHVFYCRWGRDEEDGNTNFRKVENLKEGRRLFEETFEFKTGNKWQGSVLRTLPRFIPVKGKYILHDDLSDHVSLALPLRGIIRSRPGITSGGKLF